MNETLLGQVFSDGSPFRIGRDADWDTNILDVPAGLWTIWVLYDDTQMVRSIRMERVL